MEKETRESGVFYRSEYAAALKMCSSGQAADALQFLMGVLGYIFDKEEPQNLSTIAEVAFTMAKPQHDANDRRYFNGCKGGRPKKTTGFETEKPMVFNSETSGGAEIKPNVNVNDNVNDNDNVCICLGETEKRQIFEKFFFRNMMEPNKEVARFADWGDSVGWYNKNGQKITDKVKHSRFWKPQTEGKRFSPAAMNLLNHLWAETQKAGDREAQRLIFSFYSNTQAGSTLQLYSRSKTSIAPLMPYIKGMQLNGIEVYCNNHREL